MPHTARLEELGLPFHVIVRRFERFAVFVDGYDHPGLVRSAESDAL